MSDLAQRLRDVYERLWIHCEEITQQDAETIHEAIGNLAQAELAQKAEVLNDDQRTS